MFLQSRYEKLFQQDPVILSFPALSSHSLQSKTFGNTTGFATFHKKDFKTRHPLVGSSKLNRLNFERTEQVFPKEDVPKQAIDAKVSMNQLVDPDILGLRKKDWNRSTAVARNNQEEDFERKLTKVEKKNKGKEKSNCFVQIKLGFFDTPLPKYRPNKIEAGTDTRDDYKGMNFLNILRVEFFQVGMSALNLLTKIKTKELSVNCNFLFCQNQSL